jgi:Ca2+/Na+ antiporter
MRIFNRAHVPWFLFVVAATLAAAWIYAGNFAPARLPETFRLPAALVQSPAGNRHPGSTPVGIVLGSIAFAIFIFAGLLGVRKKLLRLRIGTVQSWMRAHIWLTLLTIPLVVLHSGFLLGGPMTILLLVLYAIVMVSGIYGLILQHRIPRLMQERVPTETIYQQIPHVRRKLCDAAEELRESFDAPGTNRVLAAAAARTSDVLGLSRDPEYGSVNPIANVVSTAVSVEQVGPAPDRESEEALIGFLDQQVLPYLRSGRGRNLGLGKTQFSDDAFRFVKLHVALPYRSLVEEIQSWCDERRMLDLQIKLHHWLHGWLFVHVPLSFLLLILTGWHAFVTLFYY